MSSPFGFDPAEVYGAENSLVLPKRGAPIRSVPDRVPARTARVVGRLSDLYYADLPIVDQKILVIEFLSIFLIDNMTKLTVSQKEIYILAEILSSNRLNG